jgi:putative redox protein
MINTSLFTSKIMLGSKRKFRQKSMTSTVVYTGDLRTTCTHLRSNSQFETDAPVDNNGKGERFSPTDLMATSLATCMITVMGIRARSLGFDLEGAKVEVEKIMKADPRRISGINLFFHFPENLKQVEPAIREVLMQVGINCPVQYSIHPDIEVNINWGEWSQSEKS